MTLYYRTYSWGTTSPKITEEEVQFLNHLVDKKNWRIVQLPNGYFQTEYLNPSEERPLKVQKQQLMLQLSTIAKSSNLQKDL